jgi:hypothetical protein
MKLDGYMVISELDLIARQVRKAQEYFGLIAITKRR